MQYKFLSVDFQNEFADPEGKWFNGGTSIDFVKNTLIPFFRKNSIKISEIVSDYRPLRLADSGIGCIPGEFGFESVFPMDIKENNVWIKCMNSPIWVRKNGGIKEKTPGQPYQNSNAFNKWLLKQFGKPNENLTIILFGLTLDCCVLATAQELKWHGYNCKVLIEATDVMPNKKQEEVKNQIVNGEVLNHWLKFISFEELQKEFV